MARRGVTRAERVQVLSHGFWAAAMRRRDLPGRGGELTADMSTSPDSAIPAGENGEALTALERFVVENDDLLALELLIGKFNIFDAVKIARTEIRHSNFLAFLLDPLESHGHGQLFLTAFLMDLLKNAPAPRRPLSPIELDGAQLRGVEV